MTDRTAEHVALIGVGTIGVAFAALHLKYSNSTVSIFDPRPDLDQHIKSILPGYLDSSDPSLSVTELLSTGRLRTCSALEDTCKDATIVQEQGPENLDFKRSTWAEVEKVVSPTTHMWSSTSGIAASLQSQHMADKSRLLVVHPFNPPHIMPLLEIVPSTQTKPEETDFARAYFEALGSGHRPVVIHKELPGFVANRLAFILFREACQLVADGVVEVEDLDTIVEASLGPRWAVTGPFKAYNYGGGIDGLAAFLRNLKGTMQDIWDGSGSVSFEESREGREGVETDADGNSENWQDTVIRQTREAYGQPSVKDFAQRDTALKAVIKAKNMFEPMSKRIVCVKLVEGQKGSDDMYKPCGSLFLGRSAEDGELFQTIGSDDAEIPESWDEGAERSMLVEYR